MRAQRSGAGPGRASMQVDRAQHAQKQPGQGPRCVSVYRIKTPATAMVHSRRRPRLQSSIRVLTGEAVDGPSK